MTGNDNNSAVVSGAAVDRSSDEQLSSTSVPASQLSDNDEDGDENDDTDEEWLPTPSPSPSPTPEPQQQQIPVVDDRQCPAIAGRLLQWCV